MLTRAVLSGHREWPQTRTGISGSQVSATTAFLCSNTAIRTNRWVSTNKLVAVHSTLLLPPTEAPGSPTASARPPPRLQNTRSSTGSWCSNPDAPLQPSAEPLLGIFCATADRRVDVSAHER